MQNHDLFAAAALFILSAMDEKATARPFFEDLGMTADEGAEVRVNK